MILKATALKSPAEHTQWWVQGDPYSLWLCSVGAVAATQQQVKPANKTASLLKQLQHLLTGCPDADASHPLVQVECTLTIMQEYENS